MQVKVQQQRYNTLAKFSLPIDSKKQALFSYYSQAKSFITPPIVSQTLHIPKA